MRDRIKTYLASSGGPVKLELILRDVLNIRTSDASQAERILRTVIGEDSEFVLQNGCCTLRGMDAPFSTSLVERAAFLWLQPSNQGWRRGFRGALHIACHGEPCQFECADGRPPYALRALAAALVQLRGRYVVCWRERDGDLWEYFLRSWGLVLPDVDRLPLSVLARALRPKLSRNCELEQLAAFWGLPAPDDTPAAAARFLERCLIALLGEIPPEQTTRIGKLIEWMQEQQPRIDFSRYGFGREAFQEVAETPGVYVMKDRSGRVVYAGKSRNLRRRLRSYFAPASLDDPKSRRIHGEVHTFETIPTETELEALLLEMRLIRELRPPINMQMAVHERRKSSGSARNLILLAPRADGKRVDGYLLREGCFTAKHTLRLGRPETARMRAQIRSVFFGPALRRPRQAPWELEITGRWLAANRRRLNFVDVDEAGGYESTVARLRDYLLDPDLLTQKVIHR
jgi:hypothetical protein